MAPRDDDILGHEHTDNVELADHHVDDIDQDLEPEPQQAVPNTAVAEAARLRRAEHESEELEQADLTVREYTDAVPPPPPPPAAMSGGGTRRALPRTLTTADEPDGAGTAGADDATPAEDDDTIAMKGEEWTSRRGPPPPPESARVRNPNPWLARDD